VNQKPLPATPDQSRRYSLQALLFAAAGALTAEALLSGFGEAPALFLPIGRTLLVGLTLFTMQRFAVTAFRQYRPRTKDVCALTVVLLFSIAVLSVGRVVGLSLANYFTVTRHLDTIQPGAFEFGIPFAAGGLLLQAVFGLQYSLVLAISLAAIAGLYTPHNPVMFPYVCVSVLVASLGLTSFRSRSAYLKAGLRISVLSIPFAFASLLFEPVVSAPDLSVRLLAGLASGMLAAMLAAGVIPLLEYLGGYVTDLRLIEMATLDHPILKELSIHCPGTWNHSMVMGMMAESAASAIGANPVLSRVGAYFHDIGKIRKPLYFVENQPAGENRHEKLSSSMSALIIRSHVKDGIELGRKHGLPQQIEEMIPQHHGTSRIEFFYDKACKEAEEAGEDPASVDPNLYSYPGPRPQTREAGLLMLADGIEAAARTLADPSYDRIQGLVQKMINKVFASGELDECELTLKDLHSIAKSFTRVLSGIYHQRVAYAEPAEKVHEKDDAEEEPDSAPESRAVKPKKGDAGDKDKEDREDDREDLKRLGI
jgi:cyclic-di-AMP phosphodiesterase PgpH